MTIETYKVTDTYYILVGNDSNHDDYVTLKAVVLSLEGSERFSIRYSHTMTSGEGTGAYYSDSFTHADSRAAAKAKIDLFVQKLERADKIVPWRDDL